MWSDELQVWVIARKSSSILQLFHNIRYEGHPCFWFLGVWAVSAIWHNPIIMQLFHILIATFSVWVVFRYAPFPLWIKILYSVGYYPFCEYAIFSRGYSLTVALVFAFTAAFCSTRRRVFLMAGLLFAMAQTDVFGTILAIAFSLLWLWEIYKHIKQPAALVLFSIGLAITFVVLGIILAVAEMKPPSDSPYQLINFSIHLNRLFLISQGAIQAFFPLLPWSHFQKAFSPVMIFPAGLIVLASFLCAARNRLSLVLLSLGYLGMGVFILINEYFVGMNFRWSGFAFILFLCAQWMAQSERFQFYDKVELPGFLRNAGQVIWKPFMVVTLLASLIGSVDFNIGELTKPFSTGKNVAKYIQENNLQDLPIVGAAAPFLTTISAYLDRPIFEAANGRSNYFFVRDRFVEARLKANEWDEIVHRVSQLAKKDVLVVTTFSYKDIPVDFQLLKEFTPGVMESYGLYICRQQAETPSPLFLPSARLSGLPPTGPFGIAADSAGNLYITNTNKNNIEKWNSTFTPTSTWGSYGSDKGKLNYPTGLAVDSSGNIYVSDTGNNRIQKFTSNGKYLTQWGGKTTGSGNGEFDNPLGVAVDSSGNVYVADTKNNRVQKFTSYGKYLIQWGNSGNGNGQFFDPCGIAIDSVDNIFVVDYGNNRIQKFNSSGEYLSQWGRWGVFDGEFIGPSGITVDSTGIVYVTDGGSNRIQRFTKNGVFLNLDEIYDKKACYLTDLTVIPSKALALVTDYGDNCVIKLSVPIK